MPIDRGVDKDDVVHIQYTMEYYSAIHGNEITAFLGTWMDLEFTTLREVRRDTTIKCFHWHVQSKKKDTVKFFAKQIVTHRLWKIYDFQRRQFGGWGDVLRVWDRHAAKFGCDDCCTPINVVKFIKFKKFKKLSQWNKFKKWQPWKPSLINKWKCCTEDIYEWCICRKILWLHFKMSSGLLV